MAYEKQTWKTGDVVTSAKLNHMEDGIAAAYEVMVIGGFTLGETGPSGTSDKTWKEIHDALATGSICVIVVHHAEDVLQFQITNAYVDGGTRYVISDATRGLQIDTDSENGYPTTEGK